MAPTTQKYIAAAARASGITQDELLKRVRGLLARKGCRDTRKSDHPIFTPEVMKAIFSA